MLFPKKSVDVQVEAASIDCIVRESFNECRINLFPPMKESADTPGRLHRYFMREIQNRHECTANIFYRYCFIDLWKYFSLGIYRGIDSKDHFEMWLRASGYEESFNRKTAGHPEKDLLFSPAIIPKIFSRSEFQQIAECLPRILSDFSLQVSLGHAQLIKGNNFGKKQKSAMHDILKLLRHGMDISESREFSMLCMKEFQEIFPGTDMKKFEFNPSANASDGDHPVRTAIYRVFTYLDILAYGGYEVGTFPNDPLRLRFIRKGLS